MKKLLFVILALIVIGAVGYAILNGTKSEDLLGQDPKLYLYTINGQSTGQLNATVPFTQASSDQYSIDVAIDLNKDGQITDSEWQAKDAAAYLVQNLKSNYWFVDEAKKLAVNDEVLLKVSFKKSNSSAAPATLEKKLKIEAFEIGEMFGFDVPGAHEDIKRGGSVPNAIISVAHAEGEEVFRDAMTPDLAQDRMECAAVSAEIRSVGAALRAIAPGRAALSNDEAAGFSVAVVTRLKAEYDASIAARVRGPRSTYWFVSGSSAAWEVTDVTRPVRSA